MTTTMAFPLRLQLVYASGMAGWSILVNLIGVLLPYFYLPPSNAGWEPLLPQLLIFGVFSLLAVITSAGRLADAVYDPLIGQWSDRSTHRLGRRIPFMMWSILPAVLSCILVFIPPTATAASSNAWWLGISLVVFFVTSTTYIIPCNALLPELAATPEARVRLSTLQQAGFTLGIVVSASSNNLAAALQSAFELESRREALQWAIAALSLLAGIFMLLPVLFINERKYCNAQPAHQPLLKAIRSALRNRSFRIYIFADFAYYMALYIITSGLLYYVTVLTGQPESFGVVLMAAMVGVSLIFYPLINILAKRYGKKKLVLAAFALLAAVCASVYGLGNFPAPAKVQLFAFAAAAAFPLAALGILPPAILADIARADADATGENREGLYFAVKYFVVKLGQTLGIAVFATLAVIGKDPGNDLGLRLTGIAGAALCTVALLVFLRFREK
jgi:glycoside/pentoside/hexuronide:cation symporter, GPH family